MKILIVRHGDPDYQLDCLTETGAGEAEILSNRLKNEKIDRFYLSPLGRAVATGMPTLREKGFDEAQIRQARMTGETVRSADGTVTAQVLPWLREFAPRIVRPDSAVPRVVWDWLPADYAGHSLLSDPDKWPLDPVLLTGSSEHGSIADESRWVTEGFDSLLAENGYVRDGSVYRVEKANRDTICLFCHFGVSGLMLAHLLGVSPYVLWQGFCALPTSVTTLYTEERRKGTASIRITSYADTSHLYAAGREPSFSARFCETYDNMEERHD